MDDAVRGRMTKEEQENAEILEREARRQLNILVGQTSKVQTQTELEYYPDR